MYKERKTEKIKCIKKNLSTVNTPLFGYHHIFSVAKFSSRFPLLEFWPYQLLFTYCRSLIACFMPLSVHTNHQEYF